ncbi:MAG: replication initiator protein A [Clostridia bacterium]|nr:replication initiator protein A [Clostridia bacterium]
MTDKHVEYPFIKFPRVLIEDEKYADISIEAKILYALLLDRLCLSEINADRFTDKNGEIYVIYTVEEVEKKMGIGERRATKSFKELEDCGLIKRTRKYRHLPSLIYISDKVSESAKCGFPNPQNEDSRACKMKVPEPAKRRYINTYNNKTENNNTDTIFSFHMTEDNIRDQIEYDCIAGDKTRTLIDQTVMIMTEVFNGSSPTVRIGKEDMPRETVIARFRQLNSEHILYIVSGIRSDKSGIRNIKQYLLTLLYNVPATMDAETEANFARYRNITGL